MTENKKIDELLNGLSEAYHQACDKKDYRLCDKLRAEIERLLTGKPMLLKIEQGLNMSLDLKEYC